MRQSGLAVHLGEVLLRHFATTFTFLPLRVMGAKAVWEVTWERFVALVFVISLAAHHVLAYVTRYDVRSGSLNNISSILRLLSFNIFSRNLVLQDVFNVGMAMTNDGVICLGCMMHMNYTFDAMSE